MTLQVYSPSSPTVTLWSCSDASLWCRHVSFTTEPSLYTWALPSSSVYTMLFFACLSTMFHSILRALHSTSLCGVSNMQLSVTSLPTKTLSSLVISAKEPGRSHVDFENEKDRAVIYKPEHWQTLTFTVQGKNHEFNRHVCNTLLIHGVSDVTVTVN